MSELTERLKTLKSVYPNNKEIAAIYNLSCTNDVEIKQQWVSVYDKERVMSVVKAVANIGVDFGYGKYELEDEYIAIARYICDNEGIKESNNDEV